MHARRIITRGSDIVLPSDLSLLVLIALVHHHGGIYQGYHCNDDKSHADLHHLSLSG